MDSPQIRWAYTGSVNHAPDRDIPAWDVAYFPRGVFYGAQHTDRPRPGKFVDGLGPSQPGAYAGRLRF